MNQLPFSSNINISALSSVFNNTSATYKFYWFLAIIEEIEKGKKEIEKKRLFSRMVANAWYPINYFKVSFGSQDNISEIIKYLVNNTELAINEDKIKIYKYLINSKNFKLSKTLFHLDKNVPHWFLSPWFRGYKKSMIYSQSNENDYYTIYKLHKNLISVNENWFSYISANAKILKEYTYWNLANFLQKKNPLTPDIVSKLIKPAKRNALTYQRNNFWNIYLDESKEVKCIFTGEKLSKSNYELDHFVPYSFVSHDLIWNLVPVKSGFNSSKNNKLPIIEKHFDSFFKVQKDALNLLDNRLKKRFKEEYITIFNSFKAPQDFNYQKLKDTIEPLISVANNNGFEFLE
ncbi:HNH endonuclease domain-containing protein [Mesohalobacter halotolerans]|uniref:HNH nuclease domain-containing protein n=1 Tax=Mesohalobacter halotolerans TaxID=1883405 RepID=A0A4U5TUA8_9FLAO|nr:HNH endonuclease domain-containing protein [Mesohalobacter halotolerans]MBS3738576.1 hypothetical protein [Psychroflexus sp.]TKS57084.1 hypothetical protein FCN74_01315 [Mesohalobacter halotolerans]